MNDTKTRYPARKAALVSFPGAVSIITGGGHSIVVTPDLARKIGREILDLANRAEMALFETYNPRGGGIH